MPVLFQEKAQPELENGESSFPPTFFRKDPQKKGRVSANNSWGLILFVKDWLGSMRFDPSWRGIMESLHTTLDLVRKVALLTLVGFLVVFLIGPVVTLLGVLLPFAVVGLLVWLPFRLLVQKRPISWSGLPEKAGRAAGRVLAFPIRLLAFMLSAVKGLLRLVGGVMGFALRILIPAVAGALVFAVLGAIGGVTHQDAEFRIPAAALIGAGIGALYGALRTKEVRTVVALQPAPVTAKRGQGCC